ncbi:MAG: tetratricopeptide repeat protein [Candidatus Hydrogenedentes bacterium]|nr:tetratricopeptide repeat protein [Candidatus Hydrogenedentota bacterium]
MSKRTGKSSPPVETLPPRTPAPWRNDAVLCAFLVALTLVAYSQVSRLGFVNFDDDEYVTDNSHVQAGLTPANVWWAFTTGTNSNWHPLTWLSHMLDVSLFGLNPVGHHFTSLVLHLVNTALLYWLLRRMTGERGLSAVVAALFAVHPLHVESVAWVAERKDVLSTMFWFLTTLAYVRYVEKPDWGRYGVVVGLFALGLMAKPMLVTLPFTLLLLDYWPLQRVVAITPAAEGGRYRNFGHLIIEKIPLFVLAAASCVITYLVQRGGGAMTSSTNIALPTRVGNAVVAYANYLGKALWPHGLAAYYPHLGPELRWWMLIGPLLVLILTTALVLWRRRAQPYLPVGWFWYLGALVPVIGLVQVGEQAMADRYTYVPVIGPFIMAVWGINDVLRRSPRHRHWGVLLAAPVLLAFSVVTWIQVGYWRDSETLFRHALAVTDRNHVAHTNLGELLLTRDKNDEAIEHLRKAVEINPRNEVAWNNLGSGLLKTGQIDEAAVYLSRALEVRPNYFNAHCLLGMALTKQGRIAEATEHYVSAARLAPEDLRPHWMLQETAADLMRDNKASEAVIPLRALVELRPNDAAVHFNLAMALERLGEAGGARQEYSEALRLKPDLREAKSGLERVK